MELISSNYEDIRKYYCDSYIKLKEYGDTIFMVTKVTPEALYFLDENHEEGVVYLDDNHPYHLSMVLPHKSVYQLGDYALLMHRIPARQYHRGITTGNCRIWRLNNNKWENVGVSFINLKGYINKPAFKPLSMWNKHVSIAVSSRVAVSRDGLIFIDNRRVGNIESFNNIVINPLFAPEMAQLIAQDPNGNYTINA